MTPHGIVNALTVDVEDWFHLVDAAGAPERDAWSSLPSRIEPAMERLLALLAGSRTRATFFWLGWAAERLPALVRRCHEEGHEVASHGQHHLLAPQVGREVFAEDVRRAKALLEDLTGAPVLGVRAPGFFPTSAAPWAYEELARAGYRYSSSVCAPAWGLSVDLRPRLVETAAGPIRELPVTAVGLAGLRLSPFGGSLLRLTPWPLLVGAGALLNRLGAPVVFALHPRELDPDQPRLRNLPAHRYLRTYVRLGATEEKLRRLVGAGRFAPLGEWAR